MCFFAPHLITLGAATHKENAHGALIRKVQERNKKCERPACSARQSSGRGLSHLGGKCGGNNEYYQHPLLERLGTQTAGGDTASVLTLPRPGTTGELSAPPAAALLLSQSVPPSFSRPPSPCPHSTLVPSSAADGAALLCPTAALLLPLPAAATLRSPRPPFCPPPAVGKLPQPHPPAALLPPSPHVLGPYTRQPAREELLLLQRENASGLDPCARPRTRAMGRRATATGGEVASGHGQ